MKYIRLELVFFVLMVGSTCLCDGQERDLLIIRDASGSTKPVKNGKDWGYRRARFSLGCKRRWARCPHDPVCHP